MHDVLPLETSQPSRWDCLFAETHEARGLYQYAQSVDVMADDMQPPDDSYYTSVDCKLFTRNMTGTNYSDFISAINVLSFSGLSCLAIAVSYNCSGWSVKRFINVTCGRQASLCL